MHALQPIRANQPSLLQGAAGCNPAWKRSTALPALGLENSARIKCSDRTSGEPCFEPRWRLGKPQVLNWALFGVLGEACEGPSAGV